MMSAALAGIISVAAGLDIYFPGLAFIITFAAGVVLQPYANILKRMGLMMLLALSRCMGQLASLV